MSAGIKPGLAITPLASVGGVFRIWVQNSACVISAHVREQVIGAWQSRTSRDGNKQMTDFERIKALFPMPCKCNVWVDIKNGFQGMITSRGAYRMRRIVSFPSGMRRYEIFSVTKMGGMKSTGYAMCETA